MEPPSELTIIVDILNPIGFELLSGLILLIILLGLSGMVSGSEVAFFSLTPGDIEELESDESAGAQRVFDLLQAQKSKLLLPTILIANNLINVAIIILSTMLLEMAFDFSLFPTLGFLVQVVLVTFLILLFGEIIPKIYGNTNSVKLAKLMSKPLNVLIKVFYPLSIVLTQMGDYFEKRFIKSNSDGVSLDELSHALELTEDQQEDEQEKSILKGIVKFGNTHVKQVMKSRVDVFTAEISTDFATLKQSIVDAGYSRIPIHKDSFDTIEGVLYIKDLLPHMDNDAFDWTTLIRQPFFVPENKKIDDLLSEFQEKKIHLAIVVDEFGGSSGIITMEDIIEEIVGEISDEFDDDRVEYTKIDDDTYVFEGKTPLNDMYRLMNIEGDEFEKHKGESDTVAGFVLEIGERILQKDEKIQFDNFEFTIEAADHKRIIAIRVNRLAEKEGSDEAH